MIWSAITALIPWEWIAGALAGLVALVVAWVNAKRNAALRAENRGLKRYVKTIKAINDADVHLGDDPGVLRDGLRDRNPNQR